MGKIIKNGLEYGDTSLPSGGEKDQVLAKKSSLDNDVEWKGTGLSTEDWSDIMTPLPGQPTEGIIISPDERQVGWYYNMDGSGTKKPIYQKTVSCGALTDTNSLNASKQVNHNISNISDILGVFGVSCFDNRPSGNYGSGTIPYAYVGNDGVATHSITIAADASMIYVTWRGNMSNISQVYITLQYTKTTDTYA